MVDDSPLALRVAARHRVAISVNEKREQRRQKEKEEAKAAKAKATPDAILKFIATSRTFSQIENKFYPAPASHLRSVLKKLKDQGKADQLTGTPEAVFQYGRKRTVVRRNQWYAK